MEYKLIADSGSTKTDWILLRDDERVKRISTQGINPVMLDEAEIIAILNNELMPELIQLKIDGVDFYGAGCRGVQCEIVRQALQGVFHIERIVVDSDMLGAARALCRTREGIVCILGTGSNSCLYDGQKIVKNVSPLGFILGDEGSGAVLGKRLVGDVLKGMLPETIAQQFLADYGLTIDDVIRRVYREPMPNRFLASFAPFISRHKDCVEMRNLIVDEFSRFFMRNVAHYNRQDLPVHFVGSIAYYFRDELTEVARRLGYKMGTIKKAPLDD